MGEGDCDVDTLNGMLGALSRTNFYLQARFADQLLAPVGGHAINTSQEEKKPGINHCKHHGENGALIKPTDAEGGEEQNTESASISILKPNLLSSC